MSIPGVLPEMGKDLSEYLSNNDNAQHLSELILKNGRDHNSPIIVYHKGEKIELVQI